MERPRRTLAVLENTGLSGLRGVHLNRYGSRSRVRNVFRTRKVRTCSTNVQNTCPLVFRQTQLRIPYIRTVPAPRGTDTVRVHNYTRAGMRGVVRVLVGYQVVVVLVVVLVRYLVRVRYQVPDTGTGKSGRGVLVRTSTVNIL